MNLWKKLWSRCLVPNRSKPKPSTQRFRPMVLSLEDRTVPSADMFADAVLLTGTIASDAASNVGAASEAGEPNGEGTSGPVNSVWWQWTAPTDGPVEVNTIGSELDTALAVYTGSAVDSLSLVAANDDAWDYQSQLVFEAVAGTTYRIAVDGFADSTGDIVLNLGARPSNDDFAAAIATGGTVTGANLAASGEAGEPTAGASEPVNSVWWKWTATTTGTVEMNTFGSDFDTVLAVYTGSSVSSLSLVAANDDSSFPDALTSRVSFEAQAGTTYFIAVDGFLNETGHIMLDLPAAAPSNTAPAIADQIFLVSESAATGTVVGSVAATDPDPGQALSYSIVQGNESGAFSINSSTGQITVANAAALNYETNPTYHLIVQVTDNGSPALGASAAITIGLNDVNESPTFTAAGSLLVNENSAAGTVVGSVAATDPDQGQTLSYSIVQGNESGAFSINSSTGQITVANAAALNYEANATFHLIVEATDNGSPALGASTTLTINLSDRNDAPVLDNSDAMSLKAVGGLLQANNGTLVSELLASVGGNHITDEDAGARFGIAIIGADTSHGTWQYSINGGSTWIALGSVSNGSARLLAADANTRIRFNPGFGYSGTIANAIAFRAWDQTAGANGGLASTVSNGGASAFSAVSETASIRVNSLLNLLW